MFTILLFNLLLSFSGALSQHTPQNTPKSKPENVIATLYVFTGSDWCADCRRLEKNVLSNQVFKSSMEQNKIRIEIIDFPQRKKLPSEVIKHNQSIAETFGFSGIFPTLILSQSKDKFETLRYNNEPAGDFSAIVLNKLKFLND